MLKRTLAPGLPLLPLDCPLSYLYAPFPTLYLLFPDPYPIVFTADPDHHQADGEAAADVSENKLLWMTVLKIPRFRGEADRNMDV